MKQHITLEQLREIDSNLIAAKIIKPGIIELKGNLIRSEKFAKSMNIDNMISIIDYYFDYFKIEKESNSYDGSVYWVNINPYIDACDYELCDALWRVVKLVLNEK